MSWVANAAHWTSVAPSIRRWKSYGNGSAASAPTRPWCVNACSRLSPARVATARAALRAVSAPAPRRSTRAGVRPMRAWGGVWVLARLANAQSQMRYSPWVTTDAPRSGFDPLGTGLPPGDAGRSAWVIRISLSHFTAVARRANPAAAYLGAPTYHTRCSNRVQNRVNAAFTGRCCALRAGGPASRRDVPGGRPRPTGPKAGRVLQFLGLGRTRAGAWSAAPRGIRSR
jgi:hypothetical protein